MRQRILASIAAGILLVTGTASHAAGQSASGQSSAGQSSSELRVGSMRLSRCGPASAFCGRLKRAVDPAGKVAGSISIYFEYYPHTAPGAPKGTIVATEGGPGYAATQTRSEYLELFAPMLATRDFLIMDNRGTGKSGVIDCRSLHSDKALSVENTGACGRELGSSAPLYSSAFAADDLAAVLDALGIAKIDLYGDSYGTYFEQVFAVRHPSLLRSVVLDGAYPLDSPDYAWYAHYAPAMRDKFDRACHRAQTCEKLAGNSIDHIEPALKLLREHPFHAAAADGDGRVRRFEANAAQLATVMFASAPSYSSTRETDAAARAFIAGDRLPILRLMAETLASAESRDPQDSTNSFSPALAAAVMCQDPTQVFDMRLPPPERRRQFEKALAERMQAYPQSFAPFTAQEYLGIPVDFRFLDQCVDWPVAPPEHPASAVVPRGAPYPDVPALVLSGDLDNITTMAEGKETADSFPHGRQLIVKNGFHVNALPQSRPSCAPDLVRRFIDTLDAGDVHCLSQTPEVHLAPAFARRWRDVEPARALTGNEGNADQLKIAAAAAATAGDIVARLNANTSGQGVGLRGGSFTIKTHEPGVHFELHSVSWTEDLAIDGKINWPNPRAEVIAHLRLRQPQRGELTVRWLPNEGRAQANINGRLDGAQILADMPAP